MSPPAAKRVLAAAAGVVLTLAAVEVAARLLLPPPFPVWQASSDDPLRVLALGDTVTFGLHVEPQDAYPSQVARLWREQDDSPRPIEVVNAAVPAASSTTLRRDVRRLLDALRPDVVTVMIGSTDSFTEVDPRAMAWLPESRALQLLRAGAGLPFDLAFDAPKGFPPLRGSLFAAGERFDLGWTRSADHPDASWNTRLDANLRELADACSAAGATLMLLTYPAPAVGYVSDVIRSTAEARDITLIDTARTIPPQCAGDPCGELFVDPQHLTPAGHALVARELVAALEAAARAVPSPVPGEG